ncbi:MAG: fibronectin type III domain-containing protein [Candidatus Rokuibacteriota bacterium]
MTRRGAPAVLAALALVACGKIGPPVPPEVRLPRAVADLAASVGDGAIQLTWSNPIRRADNTRLRDLGAARVFRHEAAGGAEPRPAMLSRGRIVGYAEVGTIPLTPGSAPGPPARPGGQAAVVDGTRVTFQDRQDLVHGRRYSYVVVTDDLQGRTSPPSPRVTVAFIAPPEAPGRVTAAPGEGQVRLTWTPVTRLVDGSPAEGPILYEVLRAPDAGAPLTPVTPAPIEATEIVDPNLENERTYHYAVRALRRQGETTARGPVTERIAATPADMTPPPAPSGLVAVVAGDTVRLSWMPSPASDVARYVVYRAAPGAPFGRVGTVAAPATVFVDRDVPAGPHRYAVTAQDAGSRANESPRSNEATVSLP